MRYRPFVGANVGFLVESNGKLNKEALADYKIRYCTEDDFLANAERAAKAANRLMPETRLEYVLETGANWAAPISVSAF